MWFLLEVELLLEEADRTRPGGRPHSAGSLIELFRFFGKILHLQFINQLLDQFGFLGVQVVLGFFLEHHQYVDGLLDRGKVFLGLSRGRVGNIAKVIEGGGS